MNNHPFISPIQPSSSLLSRILLAIQQKQEQSRLWRVRVFATSAVLSVAALVPVVISLIQAFKASNFGTYLSLIFSDGGVVASVWKDVAASLVESLPVIAVAATLALVAILLWSIRSMVRFMNSTSFRTV